MHPLIKTVVASCLTIGLSGCYALYQDPTYLGPPERPASFEQYYDTGGSFTGYQVEGMKDTPDYNLQKLTIHSSSGDTVVHYYQHKGKPTPHLVLVFPVLGGKKNLIENYFADYFAKKGYDAAIVQRSEDFKKPENIDRMEQLMRENIIRDRIAIDFFEKEYGKKEFASFGISRGAINVAMTAGVEPRLKHNFMLLGGTDMVSIFKRSNQSRIKDFRHQVMAQKGFTEAQFITYLQSTLRSDPKYLASYIDARKTLLLLSVFDNTVPFRYGLKLRRQIGYPETIFLAAGHYTSIAFTQFIKLVPPVPELCVFPFDYIESEALSFYRRSFAEKQSTFKLIPYRLLRLPFDLIGGIVNAVRGKPKQELEFDPFPLQTADRSIPLNDLPTVSEPQ